LNLLRVLSPGHLPKPGPRGRRITRTTQMPTCPRCGCSGHGRTYATTCTSCGRPKFPTLAYEPDPATYVCTLCLTGSENRRQAARAGGAARARQRSLQKPAGAAR
jgi:hypothetical protein